MRVLFYFSDLKIGGCQINAINLAVALNKKNHKVFVLSDNGVLISELSKTSIQHIRINQNVRHFSLRNAAIIARLVRMLKIDIVHAFDPIYCVEAYTSRLLHTKPVIGMITAQRPPVFYLPKILQTLFVNPSAINNYVKRYNWNENLFSLLVERLDLNKYYMNESLSFNFEGSTKGKTIVALISRLDKDKLPSVLSFIQIAKYYDIKGFNANFCFVIAGDGEMFDVVNSVIEDLNIKDRILLLGEVLDINVLLNSVDVVVGMASTCLQSLAVGKPTFVIGNAGFIQLVREDNIDDLGYHHFNVHDRSSIDSSEYFFNSVNSVLRTGDSVMNYRSFALSVARKYSSDIGAEKLEIIYRDLINSGFSLFDYIRYSKEVLKSYFSYIKYLILRKLRCVE